jgi:hypothetical protein
MMGEKVGKKSKQKRGNEGKKKRVRRQNLPQN